MKKFGMILFMAVLAMSNAMVFAAEAAAEGAEAVASSGATDVWALIAQLGILAVEILKPALMALVTYAAYKLAKKFGIELGATEKAMVEEYVEKAIDAVEKWAKNKAEADGEAPSKEDKLAKAVDYLNTFLATSGLKKKSSDYLAGLIEAKLQRKDEDGL